MDDILKSIVQGAIQQQGAQRRGAAPQQSDPIADLIRGLAGGKTPAPQPRQPQAPDINDLIGGILGGSRRHDTPQSGGIADMLDMIMGGGSRRSASNPIAEMLAQKLGIPPFLAQAAVAFFMSKMLSRATGGGARRAAPQQPSGGGNPLEEIFGIGRSKPDSQTVDLDDMLDMMNDDDDDAFDSQVGGNGGMAEELAEQTGMPKGTALDAIKQIVKMVGGNRQTPKPANPQGAQMEDLLDTW